MLGMADHHARLAFAQERAETLRNVMQATKRRRRDKDAGRPRPACSSDPRPVAPALQVRRSAV